MFRSRIPFLFCRIFRFRSRRPEQKKSSSAEVSQRSSAGPPPSPSQPRRPISSQPEPDDTGYTASTPQPVPVSAHSPEIPTQGDSDHIIDPVHSTLAPPQKPILLGNVAPQIYTDGASRPESPTGLTDIKTRRVSFQVPNITRVEDPPETPLSPSPTLVSQDVEYGYAVPMEPPPGEAESAFGSTEADPEASDLSRSGSRKTRHKSLLTPQPVRANMSHFSMPAAAPNMPTTGTNVIDGRRESKRTSAIPVYVPGRRKSRWSREMNKQEILRALSDM